MSMPFIDPESIAQPEDYREGTLANDPPAHVDLDTDIAGIEDAPVLTSEADESLDHLAQHLHNSDEQSP